MGLLDGSGGNVVAELKPGEDPAVALSGAEVADAEPVESAEITFLSPTLSTGEPNFTGTTMNIRALSARGGPDGDDADMPYNAVGLAALEAWDLENDPQVFCGPSGFGATGGIYAVWTNNHSIPGSCGYRVRRVWKSSRDIFW